MYRTIGFWKILAASSLIAISIAAAASPQLINYQGRATDNNGLPLAGTYSLTFRIYDSAASGNLVWSETQNAANINGGLFTVLLGSVTPLGEGVFTSSSRYLTVQIGADPELSPRQQIVAVAYALTAVEADSASWSGLKGIPAGFADGTDNVGTGDITAVNTSGGLTGGVTSGDANISIANGGVTSTHIGDGQILNVDVNATADIAATKIAGTAATLSGRQTFSRKNTFADSVSLADNAMRVENGRVKIGNSAVLPAGSFLSIDREYASDSDSLLSGIVVTLENSGEQLLNGCTVVAQGTSGDVTGISADVNSDGITRRGAYLRATPRIYPTSIGYTYGLRSEAIDGAECYGVYGVGSQGVLATGVHGRASLGSQQGTGVAGLATSNLVIGVGTYGGATANTIGYGVYGEAWANSSVNWAAFFGGDVNVTGVVYSPAKANRIDHPLDPENKYLQHCDVQSPDMINVYTGNIVTDGNGNATVLMPDYFVAINSDFRYQLTVIGEFSQAIVAEKIVSNQFRIRTDKPNVEVSWLVAGIRQDKFSEANRIQTEVSKSKDEVGKYLHPELYGLGIEQSTTANIRMAARRAAATSLGQNEASSKENH